VGWSVELPIDCTRFPQRSSMPYLSDRPDALVFPVFIGRKPFQNLRECGCQGDRSLYLWLSGPCVLEKTSLVSASRLLLTTSIWGRKISRCSEGALFSVCTLVHWSTDPYPKKTTLERGSRSSGSRGAGAPVALTRRQPGSSGWVCPRIKSPLGSQV